MLKLVRYRPDDSNEIIFLFYVPIAYRSRYTSAGLVDFQQEYKMSELPKKRKRGTATGRTYVESRQELMREQLRLSQTEAEISALLTMVNEQLNVLKVEELQMRANSVSTDIKFIPTYKEDAPLSEPNLPKSHDEINKQNLDLDLIVANVFNTIEEEDSE